MRAHTGVHCLRSCCGVAAMFVLLVLLYGAKEASWCRKTFKTQMSLSPERVLHPNARSAKDPYTLMLNRVAVCIGFDGQ